MFKVVILLDCDECGQSFHRGDVHSSKRLSCEAQNPITAELGICRVTECARILGWHFMHSYAYSICPDCIQEEEKMSDWLQEPEDELES